MVGMVMEIMVTEVWTMEVGLMLLQTIAWVVLGLQNNNQTGGANRTRMTRDLGNSHEQEGPDTSLTYL
jgi:hypothetical protein